MKTLSHIMNTRYLCLLLSLLLVLNIAGLAAAQSSPADRELFDFPDAVDLFFAYHPGSDQAIVVVPAEGVSIMVVDTIPFAQIDQSALLDPSNWQTVDSVDLWPGETLVLRRSAGILYKLTCRLVSGRDIPRIQVTYAPVPPALPDPTPPASGELAFYDALDVDTGDSFTDPTVASVILCDAGPPPTPTPGPGVIPEPGTGILLLLGLLGLLGSWLLARRGKPTPVPSQEGNIGGRSVRFWSRRDACAPRQGKWWLFLLLLSIALLSVSGADYLIAQQSCTLMVEKQGTGSGHVIGRGIDCGPDCTVSSLEAGVSPGDVITLKAIPDDGSVFVEWLVDGFSPYQGIFRMSGDTTLTAVFEEIPNDAPLAEDDAYRTAEDVELQISAPGVLDNDSDPDGDPISAILVSGPSHGSLTLNLDGSLTYSPESDFHGTDQFTYRAFDGDLESADATVTITVNAVNEPPIAVNDAYSTDEDVELQIPAPGVLSNDSDPDGDPLHAAIVNDPSHGSLTLNPDGSCVYLPDADFSGVDQFVYRATDGELESAVAAVTITVNGSDDAPIADDLTVDTVKNRPVAILLQGHDGDHDPLTYRIVDAPQHGTLSGTDNQYTYTPETDFVGQDTFTYLVNDGTSDSNIATVTVNVLDIDLSISDVDVSQTVFDPQTMSLSGTVTVTFENAGSEEISDSYEVQVYVEDLKTATITELGTAAVSTPLAAGATLTVDVNVTGTIQFKDQLVYAFVDSEDVIAEVDEANNIAHTMAECEAPTPPPVTSDYTLEVVGQANLFGAGHAVPPGPEPGVLPPYVDLPPGVGRMLTFSSVTGLVDPFWGAYHYNGPDGDYRPTDIDSFGELTDELIQAIEQGIYRPTEVSSFGGIAGIANTSRRMFLTGVFLDDFEPTDPAPPRLNFNKAEHFLALSPLVHQTFFIGDGLTETGSGSVQQFHVPDDATRLFLGFADADYFIGEPGWYDDNVGSLTAAFTISVPLSCEDYSASYIRVDTTDFPNSATIFARIGNAGIVDLAVPLDVAFYFGDPQAGGTLLGTVTLDADLPSGDYEDVILTWNTPPYGLQDLYVVVDDDGTGQDKIRESNEDNNTASTTIFVGQLPVADAGEDQQVLPGTTVTLDGSGSSDPAGYYPLTYQWNLIEQPDGSTTVLDDPTSVTPSFTPDTLGNYLIQLIVTNSLSIQSAIDQVSVSAQPFIVDAGPDQTIDEGDTTSLSPATLTYPNLGETFTATIDWGDGSPVEDATVTYADGSGTISGLHQYLDDGVYLVEIHVTGSESGIVSDSFAVTVENVAPEIGASSVETWQLIGHTTENMLVSIDPSTGKVTEIGPIGFNNMESLAYDSNHHKLYTAVECYTVPNLIEINPLTGEGTLIGPIDLLNPFQDIHLLEAMAFNPSDGYVYAALSVENDALSEILARIDPDTGNATQVAIISGTHDNNGDGDILEFVNGTLYVIDVDGMTITTYFYTLDMQTGQATLRHQYASTGVGDMAYDHESGMLYASEYSENTLLSISLDTGQSSDIGIFHDENGPIDARIYGLAFVRQPEKIHLNSPYPLDLPFTDQGVLDTHTTSINWGDGTIEDGVITEENGNGTITGIHQYTDIGSYSIDVTLSDDDGGVDTYTVTLVVHNEIEAVDDVFDVWGNSTENLLDVLANDRIVSGDPTDSLTIMSMQHESVPGGTLQTDGTTVSFTSPLGYTGEYTFTYIIQNTHGYRDIGQVTVTVKSNAPPVIVSTPESIAVTNVTYIYQVVAEDPDNDAIAYQLLQAPARMTIDEITGQILWTPQASQTGEHDVVVQARDTFGGSDTQSYSMTVLGIGNRPPVITSQPKETVIEGQNYAYDVEAIDADGDTLSYSLVEAPSGMTIENDTGMIQWDPTELFTPKVTFFDGEFFSEDWDQSLTYFEDRGGHARMSPRGSGGNPGRYVFFDLYVNGASAPDADSAAYTFARKNTATYEPQQQGAILYIDYSHDVIGPDSWWGGGLALRQNGMVYFAPITATSSSYWVHKAASNLTENDFHLWRNYLDRDYSSHPDFSENGSLIEFGLLFGSSTGPGGGGGSTRGGIDNWSVTVTPVKSTPITVEAHDGNGGVDRQNFAVSADRAGTLEGFVFNDYNADREWDRTHDAIVASSQGVLRFHTNGELLNQESLRVGNPLALGPDGAFYYISWNQVYRYDPITQEEQIFISEEYFTRTSNGLEFGPNGDLYVSDAGTNTVIRFNGQTGELVHTIGAGFLDYPSGITFDRNGDLYVYSVRTRSIVRFSAIDDSYKGVFTSHSLLWIDGKITFGPDDHLYVANWDSHVIRFHGTTGAYLGEFVAPHSGGLERADAMHFGEDGNLYVCSLNNGKVLRYNGSTGQFIDTFIDIGSEEQIQGIIFVPLSGDPEEPPLPNWTVYLDLNENERRDPSEPVTTTNAQGRYTFTDLPAGQYTIAEEVQASWVQTAPAQGRYVIDVLPGSTTYQLHFGNTINTSGNVPPEIVSEPVLTASAWNEYLYDVMAVDHNGDPLTYTLLQAPVRMSINPENGVIVWTPTDAEIGDHTIMVQVSDGNGGVDEQQFTLVVSQSTNNPPSVTSTPPLFIGPGQDYSYQIVAVDPDGDPLSYALAQAPQGMVVSPQGTIYWPDDGNRQSPADVVVLIYDGRGRVISHAWTIVETSNIPPTVSITAPPDGAMYLPGSNILLQADATDDDGAITTVAFYADGSLLGEDTEAPYEYFWSSVPQNLYLVTAMATDDGGASATSDPIRIGVGVSTNRQPEITSNPPVTVEHETTFSYDVEASDPDHDPLTFSLTEAPTGMTIDSTTGLITWTPTVDQVGAHSMTVIVEDGQGAGASQSFTIHVTQPQSGNQFAPSITSIPSHVVILGDTYSYDVEATDGDSDPLTYSLSMAPSGMTIDANTGLITWTPTEAQLGMFDVTVLVDDGRGGIGGQYFNILVQEPNQPPTVSIGYPTTNQQVRVGDTVTIQAQAADADGVVSRVEFFLGATLLGEETTAPYEIDWTPAETDLGQQILTATAYDNENDSTTSDPITVEVLEALPDTEPPIIDITVTPEHIVLGDDVNIQVMILDDSPISDITLDIDGTPIPIVNNQATYTSQSTGFHTVTVTATDSAGNTGTGSETFGVYSGTDTTSPEVDLDDDVEFECVELAADLYDIVGSISDDNEVHYKLLSREKGVSVWDTLIEGTAALPLPGGAGVGFPNGVLTSFDPTIYRNGIHEIRLWAEDTAGNEASVDGCLLLDGRFKVGQATIGGIDFNIPQLGYPLLIGRVYDSRDREGGGFGNGWSMPHEASNVQADFTYDPAQNWGEEERGGWMKTYYLISRDRKLVVLRLGDGGVFKFRMDVSPKSSFLYPILNNASFPMTVSYIPVEDTTGTLEALNVDPEVYLYSGGVLASWDGEAYNPTRFKLTLDDGTVYVFDKYLGLLSITDPYGHAISYSDDAITHSSGASLSIERDTSNRIEYIRDQLGRTVEYQYDEDGMLVKVIQHGEDPYPMRVLEAMGYQKGIFERPVLKDIIAPDGTRLGAFEYDSQGRKTALIDHNGNRVLFGYDAPSHEYTVTDRRGNPTSYTYDSDGNVTSITDAEGYTETYTYDADGNVLAKTNKLGYTNSFTYDADGNVLSETDPLGNMVTFTYDSQGNRLTETDPLGNTSEYTYDAHGNPLTAKDALDHLTTFVYDGDGLMRSTTDALNNTTTYDYDGQGNMTTKTDPLGNSVEFTYDLYGNVIESKDEMGNVTQREYDPEGYVRRIVNALGHKITKDYHHTGKVTAYTDPAGKVTHNVFDPNGNLLSNTDPDGSTFYFEYDENEQPTITTTSVTTVNGVETIRLEKVYDTLNRVTEQIDADGLSTKAEYDALGRQTTKIDKLGNRSEVTYDPRNLPIRSVGPDGSEEISTYDAAGRVTSKTDALGRTTQYEYDKVGNVKKVLNDNGTWVENDYDALGRLVGKTSSTGSTTSQTYDAAGRLIEETDVLGRTTRYEYYPDGKRKKMIDPRGNEFTFDYDESRSQTAMHFPDGTSVTYQYNEQGENISETDQLGHTTYFEWNDLGLLQKITDPLLHETSYVYNEIGNLISQTDANSHTTTFAYNKLGRRIGKTYPLGMSQSISYDVENRTTSVTDFNGETTVSEYDQFGRLITTAFPDGSSMTYTYTTSGQIETVTDSRGTTRYEYDSEARLAQRIDPDGNEISYGYDTLGRRTSVTVPSGTTTYTYDAYGRLDTVTDPDGVSVTHYTYDTHGNKESVIYPNGIITEYGYDNLNRLISVETRTLMSDIMASYAYTLNAKGQRTHVEEYVGTQLVRTIDYEYDAADRLIEENIDDVITGVRTISYTYDPVGNRLTKDDNGVLTTYDYDENDHLLTEGGFSYGYDNNGNLLSKTGNGEQYDFSYNALNQLIHADIDTGGSSSSVDYVYDHDGIRVGKTLNGTDVTTYLVDKNRPYAQVLEEQWTNGALSATTGYVYGDALISRTTNGTTHYYHYDGMGSTRTLTDMTGAVTDTYSYDAYGNLLDKTGSTINPYLYRGEQVDDDLSAYYLRARYYQPGIGRFLTTDPVEGFPTTPMSLHRYVYGNDDPVNHFDPSGKLSFSEMMVVVGSIGISGTFAVGSARGVFDSWYEKYGDVLPDAFVFGVSGSIDFINFMAAGSDLVRDPSSLNWRSDLGGGIGGFEVLFSISSAQIGGFWYLGANWLVGEEKVFTGSLYKGWVWNLWNAKDYRGPFITVNIGPAMLFCNGWPWFFWSGPYGAGYSVSPIKKFKGTSNFSASYTAYKGLLPGMLKNYDDEGEIVSRIIGAQLVFAGLHMLLSLEIGVVPLAVLPLEASLAFMTGRAKRIWNRAHNIKLKPEEGDSPGTLYRQTGKRPKGWRSGLINQAWNLAIQYRNSR